MKNLLNYLKSKWDVATLISIYLMLAGTFGMALTIINVKRQEAEAHCTNKHGILITDKSGEYYCIKEKSVIK